MTTLRQLRYLAALAEAGHFGRAAELCNVTQPALSMQVQELEAQLGLALLERRRGGVTLTDAGREIVRRGQAVLAAVRDLEDYAHHRRRVLSGPLRLGLIPSIAPYLLPKALPALQAHYPELQLRLHEAQTQVLLAELHRGTLDLLLLALPVDDPRIETIRLFDDPFLVARRRDGHRRGRARMDPAELEEQQLLLLDEGHCLRDQALAYCRTVRPDRLAHFGATSLATIIQMVANGYGQTLLPEIATALEVTDPRIELVRFTAPEPYRAIGLAWRRTSSRKRDFIELGQLLTRCREEQPGGISRERA